MMEGVSTPQQSIQVTPKRILNTLMAYREAAALNTAIELELFSRIAHGSNSAAKIAGELNVPVKAIRVLCDFLVTTGILFKEDEEYQLPSDTAAYLDKQQPGYLGDMAAVLYSPALVEHFRQLTGSVRAGAPPQFRGTPAGNRPEWIDLSMGTARDRAKAAAVFAGIVPLPEGPLKILDAGAGDGWFGIAVARKYPEAVVVALDKADALAGAQANADQAGLGTRYQNVPGDPLQTNAGTGYDAVILANDLFAFDPPQINLLLKRCRGALKESGVLLILEPFADDLPEHAGWRLNLLAATRRGDAYVLADIQAALSACLFELVEVRPVPGDEGRTLVVARP